MLKNRITIVLLCHLLLAVNVNAQALKIKKELPVLTTDTTGQYVEIIQLSTTKNSYVDVRGSQPLSVDVGGNKSNILLDIQGNSNIVKLKAVERNFPEANMIIVCKDTVLQFLIRYNANPGKTYYSVDIAEVRKKAINEEWTKISPNEKRTEIKDGRVNTITDWKPEKLSELEKQKATSSTNGVGQSPTNNTRQGEKNLWRDSSATVDTRYGVEGRQDLSKKTPGGIGINPGKGSQEVTKGKENEPGTKKEVTEQSGKYLPEEVYEKLRAKQINLNIGDVDGGVRVLLDRLYRDGNNYYYAISIYNREKTDFLIDYTGFEIHRRGQNQSTNTDIIKFYNPQNNPTIVQPGGKSSMVFMTEKVEMLPEEFLLITLTGGEKEMKIKLKHVDFQRAKEFSL